MNIIYFGNKPKKSKILGANFEKNVLKKNFTWGGLTPKFNPLSPVFSANVVGPHSAHTTAPDSSVYARTV